jgi:hypothetical protein
LKLFMRHHVVIAAAALSAAGLTLAATTAAPAALAAPATSAIAKPVLVQCTGKGTVKPKQFTITCADGNDYLTKLKWSSWKATADGKGVNWINTCNPSCAGGKFHKFPVNVKLWRVRAWPHHSGRDYYTRMTLTYTAKVPKGFHRHTTFDLWSSRV